MRRPMTQPRELGLAGLTTILAVFAGCHCDPKIASFNVDPQGYCSTTKKIHLSWKTSNGRVTLMVHPPDQVAREVNAEGSEEYDPHDLTATLTVDNGRTQLQRPIEVKSATTHPLNGLTKDCKEGWVTTEPISFGGSFDPRTHLSSISNRCLPNADQHATCHRPVQVAHGGSVWNVAPDSSLDVSRDRPALSGDWVIKGKLLDDEQCGTASAAAARAMDLSIEFSCDEGNGR
jgi:hypothetical protein